MAVSTSPRHRWFQFSLRAMFVFVTLFGLWLGWELKIVHDRQKAMKRLEATSGIVLRLRDLYAPSSRSHYKPSIPLWREWLGDESIFWIALPYFGSSEEDVERLRPLFPEAKDIWILAHPD